MRKIGYVCVNSTGQNLDKQLMALDRFSKIFSDRVSGQAAERPQLQAMLDYIQEDDIITVTELDCLGRSNKDLIAIMDAIQQRGATLEVLNLPSMKGVEDKNLRRLTNNLVIEIYKYQVDMERRKIQEKQQQGIKKAKEKGKFKGGKRKFQENDPRLKVAFDLFLQGCTDKEVELKTGINRRTFRRYRNLYNIHRSKK